MNYEWLIITRFNKLFISYMTHFDVFIIICTSCCTSVLYLLTVSCFILICWHSSRRGGLAVRPVWSFQGLLRGLLVRGSTYPPCMACLYCIASCFSHGGEKGMWCFVLYPISQYVLIIAYLVENWIIDSLKRTFFPMYNDLGVHFNTWRVRRGYQLWYWSYRGL